MIIAVLQARVSSSRLPGKVLMPIMGKPMILREIERISRAKRIDKIILATSVDHEDDALAEVCERAGIEVFRGSLHDVLDRYYQAVCVYHPDHVVRLTGDCPLLDEKIIDQVIELHLEEANDYTSNTNPPTYPDGLDTEIMTFAALKQAWQEARLPSEREHVTQFIVKYPERFRLGGLVNKNNLSHLRWTVDEPEDFALVSKIYENLYPQSACFAMQDILKLLEQHPSLKQLNMQYERNEGLLKSLKEDQIFIENEGR